MNIFNKLKFGKVVKAKLEKLIKIMLWSKEWLLKYYKNIMVKTVGWPWYILILMKTIQWHKVITFNNLQWYFNIISSKWLTRFQWTTKIVKIHIVTLQFYFGELQWKVIPHQCAMLNPFRLCNFFKWDSYSKIMVENK